MNPLRLEAQNYRTFERLDLELPTGCVAILGANGAGKSSIVNVIELALFGARSLSSYLTDDLAEEQLVLSLEFEHRGDHYRVRRSYSGKGRGQTKVDFERRGNEGEELPWGHRWRVDTFDGSCWGPLTRETASETQALIEQTIGLSRDTFRASAFLAQGDGAAFTEAQPRDRKAILAEVLGLDVWDRLLDKAQSERRQVALAQAELTGRIQGAEAELHDRPAFAEDLAKARAAQTDVRERVTVGEELLTAARRAVAAAAEARGKWVLAQEREREAEARAAAVTREWQDRIVRARQEVERRRKAEVMARATLGHCQRDVDQNDRLTQQASEKLAETVASHAADCPTCLRPLDTAESREAIKTHYKDELAARAAQAEQLAERVVEARHALNQVDVAEAEAELQAVTDKAHDVIADAGQDVQDRKTELAALNDVERNYQEAAADEIVWQQRVADAQRSLQDLAGREARAQERLDRLAALEAEIREARVTLSAHADDLDVLLALEQAYGRDGIPALIVENAAIPQIETEANRILAELGTSFTVELRTQRALKSGDGLREALDIIVASGGAERPYETFSGGERSRINVALRLALAELLAGRRGSEVRALVLDEIEYLDDRGQEALVKVLRELTAFDKVILVSHVPALRDAFDSTLTVQKVDGRSVVVGARFEELVSA